MIQFFEEEDAAKCGENICVEEEHVSKKQSFPRSPLIFRARRPSEQWATAVSRVRIGLRVMRGFQFYTSRSLAKAVGDGRSVKERNPGRDRDLGNFPGILRKICKKIRPEDQCFMVVELATPQPDLLLHYLVMIRNKNSFGYKEDMLLGAEVVISDGEVEDVNFAFYVPLLSNVRVHLHGENRFVVTTPHDSYVLKPSTIQSQWAALTFLTESIRRAQDCNMYELGSTHWWCSHYKNVKPLDSYWRHKHRTEEDQQATTMLDIFGCRKRRKSSPSSDPGTDPIPENEKCLTENEELLSEIKLKVIQNEIRNVMHKIDMEVADCGSIRKQVEKNLNMNLADSKSWVNEQILTIYGQMDEPSLILDYLYLGTEWNACNVEELQENGVTHILNVSRDIENFFEKNFQYLRVDVLDRPDQNLLEYWQETYNFIKSCKEQGGKILIHCQMGVSRSASCTIAFIMKEYEQSFKDTLHTTKAKRNCVKPNPGFHTQLEIYEEILRTHGYSADLSDALREREVNEP
ncbi:protein phosphatase Slingshot-like isoform X2 [Bolinopsis microptera]|uniref:protein phosphatase Slingshot-like isoform X2 n=1 Tax=Bolinopsis microptera TaxID=2820187 RepID=UPI003078F763